MMKSIDNLFNMKLIWKSEKDTSPFFYCNKFSKNECYLRMNDFPEEPMWTLFYNGESIDFDDSPELWGINYE